MSFELRGIRLGKVSCSRSLLHPFNAVEILRSLIFF